MALAICISCVLVVVSLMWCQQPTVLQTSLLLCSSVALDAVSDGVPDANLTGFLLLGVYIDDCCIPVPKGVVAALAAARVVEVLAAGTPPEPNLYAQNGAYCNFWPSHKLVYKLVML